MQCDGTKHEKLKASVGFGRQSHFPAETTDEASSISAEIASNNKLKNTLSNSETETDATKNLKITASIFLTAKGSAVSAVFPSSTATMLATKTVLKTSDRLYPVRKSAFASQATMENISSNIKAKKSSLSIPKRIVKSATTPNIEPRFSGIQADMSSRQTSHAEIQNSAKLMMNAKERKMMHARVEKAVTEWSIRVPRSSKTESDAVPIGASSLRSSDMVVVTNVVPSSKHTAVTTTILRIAPSFSVERLRTEVKYNFTLQSRIEPSLSVSQEDLQTPLEVKSLAKTPNSASINSLQSISDTSSAEKLNGTHSADVDSTLLNADASMVSKNPIITSRISFVPYLKEETQISSTPKLDAQQLLQISKENMNTISRASAQGYQRLSSLLFQEEDRSASIPADKYGLRFSNKIPTARVAPLQTTVSSSSFRKSIHRIALQRREDLSPIYQNKRALVSSNAELHQRLKSVHASAQLVLTKKIGLLQAAPLSFSTTKEVDIANLSPAPSEVERIVVRAPTACSHIGQMRIAAIIKASESPSEQGPKRGSLDAKTMPSIENLIAQSSKETKKIIHSTVAPSYLGQDRIEMTKARVRFSKVTEYSKVDMIFPKTEQFLKRKKPRRASIVKAAGPDLPKATPCTIGQTRMYKVTKAPQVLSRVREHTEVDAILPAARNSLSSKKPDSPSILDVESKQTDPLKVTSVSSKQTQTLHLSRSAFPVLQLKIVKSFTTNYRSLKALPSSKIKVASGLSTAYELKANSMFTAISSHPKQLQYTEFSDVSAVASTFTDVPQRRIAYHMTRLNNTSEKFNLSRIPSAIRLSFFKQPQKHRGATTNERSQTNSVSVPPFYSSNSIRSTEVPAAKSKITTKDKRKRTCKYPWPTRRLKFMHLIRICPPSKNKGLHKRKIITSMVSHQPSSKYVSSVFVSSSVNRAIAACGLRSKARLDESRVLRMFGPSLDTVHFQVFPKLTVDSVDESKYLFFSSPRRDIISSVSDKKDKIPSNSVFGSSAASSALSIDYKDGTNAEMTTGRLDTLLVNGFKTALPLTVALTSYTKTRTYDCTSHTSHALVSKIGPIESIQTPVISSLDATSKVTEMTQLQRKVNSTEKKKATAQYGDQIRLHTCRSLADDFKLLETTANHRSVKLLKSPSLTDLEFGDLEAERQLSLSLGSQRSLTATSVKTGSDNTRFSEHPQKEHIPSSAEILSENTMETMGMNKEPIVTVIRPSPSSDELRPYKTNAPRQDLGLDFIFGGSSLQLFQTKTRNYADYRSITYGYNIFDDGVLRSTTSNLHRTPPLSSFLDNDLGSVQNFVSETFSSQQIGITDKQSFTECTERQTFSTPESSLLSSTEEEKVLESSPNLKQKDIELFATTLKQRHFMASSNSQIFLHHGTATIYSKTSDLVLRSEMETERPEDASVMGANKFRSIISTSGKSLSSNITDRIFTRLPMFLRSLLLSVSTSVRSLLPKSTRIHEGNKTPSIIDLNSRKIRTSSINFERFTTLSNQLASRHFKDAQKKESVLILQDRSRLTTPSIVQKILRLSLSSEEAKIRVSVDFTTAIMHSSAASNYFESTKSSAVAEKLENQDKIAKDSCSGRK